MRHPKEAKLRATNDNICFIPLHILEEILFRLEAKSLFRCAFVCRSWNELITSPDFISRSSNRIVDFRMQILLVKACRCKKNYESRLIHFPCCQISYSLHWDNDQFDFFRTIGSPIIDDFKSTRVIGVSNGLVCLANKQPFRFILWNPTIRKYVWLPLEIAWDEKLCNVAFAFDQRSNDFKVVNFVYSNLRCEHIDSCWVFSYVTWSWKRIKCNIPPSCEIDSFPHIYFNGVFHWIAIKNITHQFIVTFDLTNEVVGQMSLPETLTKVSSLNSIVTTGESLAVVELKESYDEEANRLLPYVLSVWIMKQYGNYDSWTKIFSITLGEKIYPNILGMKKNGDIILEMINSGEIYRYNPTSSTNIRLKALEDGVFFPYYTESLYLLEKKKEYFNSY